MPFHKTKKPIEYKIVRESFVKAFEKACTELLLSEWEPLGGVNVFETTNSSPIYYQAFIKYKIETTDTGPI